MSREGRVSTCVGIVGWVTVVAVGVLIYVFIKDEN